MKKIWAICSGSDWADACVQHLILPDGMNIAQERQDHKKWLREEYQKTDFEYKSFVDFLILRGATVPKESILEEFWND